MRNILVIGLGYVGLANALLLSQSEQVMCYDIDRKKIEDLKKNKLRIKDKLMLEYLKKSQDNLQFVEKLDDGIRSSDIILISTPTDFNDITKNFDTTSIEKIIKDSIKIKTNLVFIIKSTIPIGYTNYLRRKYIKSAKAFIFSPEFLREGSAMYDVLNPERIIIGEKTIIGKEIGDLFKKNARKKNIPVLYTNAKEAESIKLFSNSYLALRVAFFNEIDNYSIIENLNIREIIEGVCLDSRIGSYYNNPSFGYGGYCLPKDTMQIEHIFIDKPSSIIGSITKSNEIRTSFIAKKISELNPKLVGIYLLDSKKDADNFRFSSMINIIRKLQQSNIEMVIFDPNISSEIFKGIPVEKNFSYFCVQSEIIVTNRMTEQLENVKDKVFTRDVYKNN